MREEGEKRELAYNNEDRRERVRVRVRDREVGRKKRSQPFLKCYFT